MFTQPRISPLSRNAHKTPAIEPDAFAQRVAFYRRQFAKGIGCNPSRKLKYLVDNCAFAAADCERARADQTLPITTKVAILREGRLAQRALERELEARREPPSTKQSLRQVWAR
jgi:hypothetical protein